MGWLENAIAKYTEKKSDGTPKYDWGPYVKEYGQNSVNGTTDTDKNGRLDIDCSHLVNNVLKEAGYNINYENTSAMKNSKQYDVVTSDIRPGDIVLFNGHVGIVVEYDPATGKGKFFGSQTSTGPATAAFGPGAYWSKPAKFLRPKSGFGPTGSKGIIGSMIGKVMGWINQLVGTATTTRSPIILDLDGNGIQTLGTDAGIHFDHDGNGFKELSGWVAPGDGVLMLDRDADAVLDNGSELFGNFTPLANGMLAVNGFQALAQFDTNKDGKIDASDPIWSQLKVWQHDPEATDLGDPDSSGMFTTLDDLGIQSINTGYANSTFVDENGNAHKEIGSFTWNNGTTGAASDVYFQVDNMNTIANEWVDVPEDIAALPDLQGYGNVYDLQQAMARERLIGSDTLKALVDQFAAEADADARHSLIIQILYKWTGVENVDPLSRAARIIYGNAIGDARKLATLEAFMGEGYVGTWCWGERDPNPHGPAAKILLQAFDELADSIYSQFMAQTHFKDIMSTISVTWNSETEQVEWDVSATPEALQALYITNPDNAPLALSEFADIFELAGDAGVQALEDLRAMGDPTGDGFLQLLSAIGMNTTTGNANNNTLQGTSNNDALYGMGGNDNLKLAA